MNVLLWNPPSSRNRKPILPMSLLSLGAVLEEEPDVRYRIVDGNLERDVLATLDQALRDERPDVLAVTVMPGPQLQAAVPVCRELKRRHPRVPIVWGGYFPTQHVEACLRAPYVDFVVRGHGEMAFRDLLRAMARGDDPASIPGVATRDAAGGLRASALPPLPHPDRLPDFPHHRLPVAKYLRRTFLGSRTVPHHTSYGCPFTCNFCSVVYFTEGRWLAASAQRAASVVRRLATEHGANGLELHDNNFFVSEPRSAEFAERIADLGMRWWAEARVDTMLDFSEATWALLARSGLAMVFLGAESGSDEALQRMDKGGSITTEKTLQIAERCARHGIVPEMSFMLGNPPDPEGDVSRTLAFIRRVKQVNPATEVIIYVYTPVPLSGNLYDDASASGFRFPETLDEWTSPRWAEFAQRKSATLPWIRDPVRRRVHGFQRVLYAYHPTATDLRLHGWRRALLRGAAAWRWALELYELPIELQVLQRFIAHERPETSGF